MPKITENLLKLIIAACLPLIFIIALKADARVDAPQPYPSAVTERKGSGNSEAALSLRGSCFAVDPQQLELSRELDSFLIRSKARWSNEDKDDVVRTLIEIESKYGFHPGFFLRLMKVESNFKIDAVSRDGARGLCQIQPETARQISKRLGQPAIPEELLFDPVLNLKLSAEYLSYLEFKYKALPKAVSAYNMGPGAFSRIYGDGGIPKGRYNELLAE
jgi:soluble lytic murein transglycosylase-like protein